MSTNHECAAPRTTMKKVSPLKEHFSYFGKNKMIFNIAFMRVFDSFLFIKGIFVWSRYSNAEFQLASKNTGNTKPLLHSCPYQAFSRIKS